MLTKLRGIWLILRGCALILLGFVLVAVGRGLRLHAQKMMTRDEQPPAGLRVRIVRSCIRFIVFTLGIRWLLHASWEMSLACAAGLVVADYVPHPFEYLIKNRARYSQRRFAVLIALWSLPFAGLVYALFGVWMQSWLGLRTIGLSVGVSAVVIPTLYAASRYVVTEEARVARKHDAVVLADGDQEKGSQQIAVSE